MSKDNGGAAFPSHGTMGEVVCEGMALRDYFAAKAMQGLIVRYGNHPGEYDDMALISYGCADAMLAERAK